MNFKNIPTSWWGIFILSFLSLQGARALEVKVLEPCSDKVLYQKKWTKSFDNVGIATVRSFDELKVPYVGNDFGIHSIHGTPVGDDALEIISRMEMRSYGWCYKVDDELPEVLPINFPLESEHKTITWYFGFARYLRGEWVSQCESVSKIKPQFICRH